MKNFGFVIVIVGLSVLGSYVLFADDGQGVVGDRGDGAGMMDGNGMSEREGTVDRRGAGAGISGMTYNGTLIPTADGGIAVLIGTTLTKYNTALNVVKSVEVEVNWENWRKMMEEQRGEAGKR